MPGPGVKTALVTGAARGIGLADRAALLQRGLPRPRASTRLPDAGDDFERVEFDLTAPPRFAPLVQRLGEIHVLVNNAGMLYCDRRRQHPPRRTRSEILARQPATRRSR